MLISIEQKSKRSLTLRPETCVDSRATLSDFAEPSCPFLPEPACIVCKAEREAKPVGSGQRQTGDKQGHARPELDRPGPSSWLRLHGPSSAHLPLHCLVLLGTTCDIAVSMLRAQSSLMVFLPLLR